MFSFLTNKGQRLALVLQKIPKYSFAKALKQEKPETYLKAQPLEKPEIIKDATSPINIEKFEKKSYVRGLEEEERPIPISPILGPMRVILFYPWY